MNTRDIRKKLGLNQVTFWSRLGVTQSGGSRYEAGRTVPKPVQKLVTLAFGSKAAALKVFNELRGIKEEAPTEYFVVISGTYDSEQKPVTTFTSEPIETLSAMLAVYLNLQGPYDWRAVELHMNNEPKAQYIFSLCREVKATD